MRPTFLLHCLRFTSAVLLDLHVLPSARPAQLVTHVQGFPRLLVVQELRVLLETSLGEDYWPSSVPKGAYRAGVGCFHILGADLYGESGQTPVSNQPF